MSEGLLAAEALLDVDAHELADELLGVLAYVVPVGRVELKFSCETVSGSSWQVEKSERAPTLSDLIASDTRRDRQRGQIAERGNEGDRRLRKTGKEGGHVKSLCVETRMCTRMHIAFTHVCIL